LILVLGSRETRYQGALRRFEFTVTVAGEIAVLPRNVKREIRAVQRKLVDGVH